MPDKYDANYIATKRATVARAIYFASYYHPENEHSQTIRRSLERHVEENPGDRP